MSSLITIKDSKLHYNLKNTSEDISTSVKIISVIGKARTGKSTLMNLLISKWSNTNTTVFKMSDSGDHCTNGVDYYYVKDLNIILLDFQGIYLGDSSQDSKLLLLAYLLSDVIIFNENKMLSNNTLSQFEPMLSFIQYMNKEDNKKCNPKLIFRITDVNLNIEPTTNMHQMLSHQNDQFQSIRDCINELFDEPFAINTNNLDRSEFKLLKQEDFLGILTENDNGFNNAMSKINDYLGCCNPQRTYGSFLNDIRRVVQSINDQKKIDFKKLDVVLNLANYEILDYITKIDQSLYSDILVDGTQKLYTDNLLMRIKSRDKIIEDIYKKFKKIPKNIVDAQLPKFTDKVNPLIEKATEQNLEQANNKMKEIIKVTPIQKEKKKVESDVEDEENEKLKKKKKKVEYDSEEEQTPESKTINPLKMTFTFGETDNYKIWIKELEDIFKKITKDSSDLFVDVLQHYEGNKNALLNLIKVKYDGEKAKIDIINSIYETICKDYNIKIDNNILEMIDEHFNIDTHDTLDAYYHGFIDFAKKHLEEQLLNKTNKDNKTYNFNIFLTTEKLMNDNINNIDTIINFTNTTVNKTSQTLIKMCDIYKDKVTKTIESHKDTIFNYLSKKREDILTGLKSSMNDKTKYINEIIQNNPQIIFVQFVLSNKKYIMTQKYFDQTLKKDFTEITKICSTKDYQNDWAKFMKEITNIKIQDKTKVFVIDFNDYKQKCSDNYRKTILMELFELEFKKYYVRNKFIFEF